MPARPRNPKIINYRISPELEAEISRLAREGARPKQTVLRLLLEHGLANLATHPLLGR